MEDDSNQQNNNENIDNDNENQEDENDILLHELQLQLAQMKNERKEAQKNAQLLDNRINILKREEEKNWKKIENKKKKANEKLIYLKNLGEHIKQREKVKEKRKKELETKKKINKKMKEEIKNETELKKKEKQKKIIEEAQLLKKQRKDNEDLIAYLNNENCINNQSKCAIIKSQHSIGKEKKKLLERERKAKLREKLEKQLLEEYRLKEEADEIQKKREKEEEEILKRLQTTTQIDKNISEEIEKINLNNVMNGDFDNLSNNINNNM